MKKENAMLIAIAVVGVVSGVLAFKAKHSTNPFYSCATAVIGHVTYSGCVVTQQLSYEVVQSATTTIAYASTFSPMDLCKCLVHVIPIE